MQRIYSKLLLLTLFSTSIVAQEQIGVAAAVNRNTTDLTVEQERKLVEAGYQIIQNHTIETDEIGKAQMLLLDGTAFSVGPNSSVVLDRFIYNPETAEGSLEVTARGLLRIVGGKVTKKQPALIRTNSATVGIRGGIGIVQTEGSQVNATFLYGEEMTVTPNCVDLDTFGDQCGADFITTITEPGFSVSVESADSEPSEPEPVTEESLDAVQDELEASEEEPAEEESSSEESSDDSSSEESSSEESSDDSSGDESSSDESSSDDSVGSDSSSDDASSDSSSDEPTNEVAQETESDTEVADAGDSGTTEVEVDEGLLDSSGVSDVSSDVAPDELGTADAFEVETEIDLVDVDESQPEEVTEEVAQTTQETTAEVAPIFEVKTSEVVEAVNENTTEISLASFAVVNPGEQNYTVNVEGEGSEAFTYNKETNSLEIIEELDHESQEAVELTVTFTSDNGDVQEVALALNVADVDEAAELAVEPVNTISETAISAELVANQVNVSETIPAGTVVATFSATDPEGNALTYSLSGAGSELMTVSEAGEVTLTGNLDFEANSTLVMTLEVSDGTNTTTEEIFINVINDDEPASIAATLSAASFAENSAVGAAIASVNATDPEGSAVTYTLSGTGSDNFAIDASGNITLASTLDYETANSYKLTVVVDDGTYASTEVITVNVADVNEAPTLSAAVAFNAFQENTAIGTTIATSSVTDSDAGAITYSLSGAGSENFSVSSDGTVTLASALDYETATAYEITLTASDGDNSVSETLTINVGDINEAPAVSLTVAAGSVAEDVSTGTSIATSSFSDPESDSVSYTLGGVGSNNFSVDANGTITVANSLDFETQTSYELTLTVSDGTSSTQETFNISVTDIPEFALALSSTSPSIDEGANLGTQVATSTLTQQDSAPVVYELSGTGSDEFLISSTGVITTADAMDYETTNSYSLTVTVSDGTNTDTETINISVNDLTLNTLATTVVNSGTVWATLLESSSSGTAVASSSVNNPDGETINYSLSGTGSSNFSVDSSGNVTSNATLDFETAKSYALTLTATAGGTAVTDTFTVNVRNENEINSVVLRYSADYHAVSRSGFAATATRGPSGSSLPNYYLEQVGTAPTDDITNVQNLPNDSVPVEIAGGTALNWRYFFPLDDDGNGQYGFAPNSGSNGGKYQSILGSSTVQTTFSNSEVISAGRMKGGNFWFMTTDKAAANINYTSALLTGLNVRWNYQTYHSSWTTANNALTSPFTLDLVSGTNALDYTFSDVEDYQVLVHGIGVCCSGGNNYGQNNFDSTEQAVARQFLQQSNRVLVLVGENNNWANQNNEIVTFLESIMDGSDFSQSNAGAMNAFNFTYEGFNFVQNAALGYSPSTLNCDSNFNTYCYGSWAFFPASMTDSEYLSDVFVWLDVNQPGGTTVDTQILGYAQGLEGSANSSTYNLYEDQVTIAGRVDAGFQVNTSKFIYAFAVMPREHFSPSGTSNDYFYPNFIPRSIWSYGDVGVDYCLAVDTQSNCNSDYSNVYKWQELAFRTGNSSVIYSSRFGNSNNNVPEGMSLWYQHIDNDVFDGSNNQGVLPGLWAQISFKDSYDGASGSTTRDDQESLLNVVISQMDARKYDTTRYSAGDTNIGLDGYHYWSYQQTTNANDNSSAIVYGTSVIECATANDVGCFYGGSAVNTKAAMLTSSDPYKSGDMTLSVSYDGNSDTFSTGSFNQAIIKEHSSTSSNLIFDHFSARKIGGTGYDPSGFSGFFSGILEFDVSGTGNSQLASLRSSSTLASFAFDSTYHDVQVVAPVTVSAAPANNYTATWSAVDTGSMTLKFGDANNDEAKSAYFSWDVLAAEIQDDGTQIDGTSGGSNNLAGVMVSFNTLDTPDSDLFHTGGNDAIPDTSYSSWGFWAMSAVDVSPNSGAQNASVHLGTWVGGETLAQNEIPTSGSASMSGAAVMSVAYRHNKSGTDYDVHKYTTTADVAASFTWGSSGYSGSLDFTNFDDKNTIVANAGFTSFTVAITGTDHTYTGNSTDTLTNGWLGGASVAGALYGDTSPDESGGRINVNLYKSGDISTAGANDFYMAEGIYLLD